MRETAATGRQSRVEQGEGRKKRVWETEHLGTRGIANSVLSSGVGVVSLEGLNVLLAKVDPVDGE